MIDTSNECLINQKRKKSMISFESISEKQEESSNSSVKIQNWQNQNLSKLIIKVN